MLNAAQQRHISFTALSEKGIKSRIAYLKQNISIADDLDIYFISHAL